MSQEGRHWRQEGREALAPGGEGGTGALPFYLPRGDSNDIKA